MNTEITEYFNKLELIEQDKFNLLKFRKEKNKLENDIFNIEKRLEKQKDIKNPLEIYFKDCHSNQSVLKVLDNLNIKYSLIQTYDNWCWGSVLIRKYMCTDIDGIKRFQLVTREAVEFGSSFSPKLDENGNTIQKFHGVNIRFLSKNNTNKDLESLF